MIMMMMMTVITIIITIIKMAHGKNFFCCCCFSFRQYTWNLPIKLIVLSCKTFSFFNLHFSFFAIENFPTDRSKIRKFERYSIFTDKFAARWQQFGEEESFRSKFFHWFFSVFHFWDWKIWIKIQIFSAKKNGRKTFINLFFFWLVN